MTTLVFADLHLGTANNQDAGTVIPWLRNQINQHRPGRIVFAGDTFELILPMDHRPGMNIANKVHVLQAIVETWDAFFAAVRDSTAKEIVFITGEHDYQIADPNLLSILQNILPSKTVSAGETFFDCVSRTLICHGHQFDYNRVFWKDGEPISLIDGLTIAINTLIAQTPDIEEMVRRAAERGVFSYWYAYGELPSYISAMERIFGADPSHYFADCARVIRSDATKKWLEQHTDPVTRCLGQIARIVALSPRTLFRLYRSFYVLLEMRERSRIRKILHGLPYADKPPELHRSGIKNLVLAHFHSPGIEHHGVKSIYKISSPRLHTEGIRDDMLHVFRDFDCVVIDGQRIAYQHERIAEDIPLSKLKEESK
ncbi:MAG: hypothetical protein AAB798_01900 [Patescibacteria group bacterium]